MADKTKQTVGKKVLTVPELMALLTSGQKNEESKRTLLARNLRQLPNGTKIGTGACLKILERLDRGPKSGKRNNPEALKLLEALEKDGIVEETDRINGSTRQWKIVGGVAKKPSKGRERTEDQSGKGETSGDQAGPGELGKDESKGEDKTPGELGTE